MRIKNLPINANCSFSAEITYLYVKINGQINEINNLKLSYI